MTQPAWSVSSNVEEFDEAVKWFLARVPMTREKWDTLTAEARRKALTVAGVARADVLHSVLKALDRAISAGGSLKDFKTEVGPKLLNEWRGTVKNPSFRLELIFRNNVQSAYSAGRWAQMTDPAIAAFRPFLMFDAILDGRTSDTCRPLNGVVLPIEEWAKRGLVPPLHHACRSGLRSLRKSQAEKQPRYGKPVPAVQAQEGWGLAPDKSEWAPDLSKYPPKLRKHVQARLAGTKGVGPMPPPSSVKLVPKKAPKSKPVKYGSFEQGKHAGLVKTVQDRRSTGVVLKGASKADVLGFLEKRPLSELTVGAPPLQYQGTNGLYSGAMKNLWVTSPRGTGTFGERFAVSNVWSISTCAKTALMAQQRTFVHELAHHIHRELGSAGVVIQKAWANSKRSPITIYAGADAHEYFAESFAAYHYHHAALKKSDPIGFAMVEDVIRLCAKV